MSSTATYTAEGLATPEVVANPFPAYDALRPSSPLWGYRDLPPGSVPGEDEPVTAWVVLRYEHVIAAAKDHQTFSSRDSLQAESTAPTLMLVHHDQPEHTQLRRLINQAFTRKRVEDLRPWMELKIRMLLDSLDQGEIEWNEAVASRVPASVMARFLGAPLEDAPLYKAWANAFMLTEEMSVERRNASAVEVFGYFTELVGRHAARLADGTAPSDELVPQLLSSEVNGRRLTTEEVILTCITLLMAGAETTLNFGSNLADKLIEHPEVWKRLQADRSLIPAFMDETLRLTGPVQRLYRIATRDTQLGEAQIREGEWVALFWGAANRDPDVFPNPHVLDLDRPNAGKHLSFGMGIHFCAGAPLARLEMSCLLEAMLDRYDRIEASSTPAVQQSSTLMQYCKASLPVTLTGRCPGA